MRKSCQRGGSRPNIATDDGPRHSERPGDRSIFAARFQSDDGYGAITAIGSLLGGGHARLETAGGGALIFLASREMSALQR